MTYRSTLQHHSTFVWWRYLLALSMMIFAYIVLGSVSGRILSVTSQLPIIWLPAGMTLAVVVIGGYRYLPGLTIGVLLLGIMRGKPADSMLVMALSNTLTIAIAYYLLQAVGGFNFRLKKMRDIIILVAVGGFGSMLIGAIMVTFIGLYFGEFDPAIIYQRFINLWMGSALAVLFVTPLIFAWYDDRSGMSSWRRCLESALLVAFAIFMGWVIFANIFQIQATMPISFMLLPAMVWAMIRFSFREVTLINAIGIACLIWSLQTPDTLIWDMSPTERLIFTWSTVGIGSVLVLLIKVLIDERRMIEDSLLRQRDFTTQILETLGQGITVVAKDGTYEYVNPAFANLLERDASELIGVSPYTVIADSFKPELDEIFRMRKAGKESTYRAILKNRHGEDVTVLVTGVPRLIDGEHVGSISVLTDIRPMLEAEKARMKSETEFRHLFENTEVGIYRREPDGYVVAVNQTLAGLMGYESPETFLQDFNASSSAFYVDSEHGERFRTMLDTEGKVSNFEAEAYRYKTGEKFWVSESAYAVYDDKGEMSYYEGIVLDITPRKLAEQELQRSEALFRAIFENSAESIIVIDKIARIVMANRAHRELLGYTAEEISRLQLNDYIHPDDRKREEDYFIDALNNHKDAYQLELRYIRKDGSVCWIDASVGMVWDNQGNYLYAIGISRDITESRRIKLAIENSERRFRAIFENASLPIAVTREDRKIGMANPAFCNMVGYTQEELQDMQFDDFTYPGDNIENLDKFQKLLAGDIDSFTVTKRYVHRDGSPVWAKLAVSRFYVNIEDTVNEHFYTIAIAENITERKLAEDRLNAEVRLNDRVLNALPGVFYLFDADGNFLRWNKQLQKVSGFSDDEMLTVKPHDFIPESYGAELDEALNEVFEEGYTYREFPMLRRDGHLTPHLMNGYRIMLNDMPCVIGVGIDVSNLKQAETALRESEERYRTIFENSLIGIYRSTIDGRFLSVNPSMVEILGYDSAEELYNLNIERDVYIVAEERNSPQRQQLYQTADVVEDHEVHLKKKNGEEIVASVRAKVIRDDEGNILYFEGSLSDVTAQYRQAEQIRQLNQDLENRVRERTEQLQRANEQLLELDRLRAKFIADMSHEMRTPLAVLNTRLYLLQHNKDNNTLERHIEGISIQLDRLQEFVENAFELSVLDMSRDNISFETVSLNAITAEAINALAPRAEVNDLVLTYDPSPLLPDIIGVESHLSQVVTNLIGNAIKYTEEGYVLVSTGVDSITHRVYVRVEDSGMGIATEDIPHLFSRFYRGDRAGQSTISGTGLGLSIVKEIVDAHDGHIDVESQIDTGSIFTVWLPIERDNFDNDPVTQDDATATLDE